MLKYIEYIDDKILADKQNIIKKITIVKQEL